MYLPAFLYFEGYVLVMQENILFCRKYAVKDLRVMRYHVGNFLSNESEKKFVKLCLQISCKCEIVSKEKRKF